MLETLARLIRPKGPALNVTFLKNPEESEYVAFFQEYPVVASQGKTKKDALKNLNEDFVAALKMQVRNPHGHDRYITRLWIKKIADTVVLHDLAHLQLATLVGEAKALLENNRV